MTNKTITNIGVASFNAQRTSVGAFLGRWLLNQKSKVQGLKSKVSPPKSSVSPSIPHSAFRTPHSQGFTLLELMTVMVIMFILMGMSTLALRGVMRGAGVSGAVANVRSILTHARQQAIMKQQPTAVIFGEDPDGRMRTMRVIISFGTVESVNAGGITVVNDMRWTAVQLDNSPIYNFRGGEGKLLKGLNPESYRTFGSSGISWDEGDQVAFAEGVTVTLPPGITFDQLPTPPIVQFAADGSSPGGLDMEIVEINAAGSQPITVEVNSGTGWIKVYQPGEAP